MNSLINSIEEIRLAIRELQRESAALNAQSRSRREVREHVARLVNHWKDEADRKNVLNLRLLAAGQHPAFFDIADTAFGANIVLVLGAGAVEQALLRNVEIVEEGVDTAARVARVAQIGDELDALEAEEEALIERAEDAGDVVLRRADARPEIVLGTA